MYPQGKVQEAEVKFVQNPKGCTVRLHDLQSTLRKLKLYCDNSKMCVQQESHMINTNVSMRRMDHTLSKTITHKDIKGILKEN